MKDNIQILVGPTAATAATGTLTFHVPNLTGDRLRLVGAQLNPNAALTAHADNHRTIAIANGADALVTPLTTSIAGTGNLVAGTMVPFAVLAAAGAALELANGGVHTVTLTHGGTGVAINAQVALIYERMR